MTESGEAKGRVDRVSTTRYERAEAVFEELDGEMVLLDLATLRLTSINDAGRVLWDALERPMTQAELADVLAAHFGIDPARAAADTAAFVSSIESRGLVRTV